MHILQSVWCQHVPQHKVITAATHLEGSHFKDHAAALTSPT